MPSHAAPGFKAKLAKLAHGPFVDQADPVKVFHRWEPAILEGYGVFRQIRTAEGGWVFGDRALRTIRYAPLESIE